ncbi:MAG: AsmA family protein [Rhodospirillales bacterium]|nr:AsmA family protein [Rhodospirillales bacterium]
MHKFVLILLGIAILAVAGAVVVLLTLDFNAYRPQIEAELEAVTGREVTIAGDVRVTFIPSLAVSVGDITVAGAPGGSGDPFLELPDVLAVVSLAPLASLEVVVERIRLIEPVIVLEQQENGPASWALEPVPSDEHPGGGAPAASIELVDIQDARIEWRDGADRRRFDEVDLWIDALGADGPLEIRGVFLLGGREWTLETDVGRISRPQLPLNATLSSGDDLWFKVAGTIATGADPVAFSGQIEARAARLGLLTQLVDPAPVPPALGDMPFTLDTGVSFSTQAVRLSDLVLGLGSSQATGSAFASLGHERVVDLTLASTRLDLDALLAGARPDEGQAADAAPWPDDLTLTAALNVDAADYRGERIRQFQADVALQEGRWDIERLQARLPGGTQVALNGTLGIEEDTAIFRGPIEATSDNLRATLQWLGIDLDSIPRDRLRRVDVFADVVLSENTAALTGLDLSVDSSRLTGDVAAKIGQVPTITAGFVLDQLNLDAYLADATDTGDGNDDVLGAAAMFLSPVNVDLNARIDALTWNGVAVSGFVANGTLLDGRLDIASLGASDVAGAALRTSGTIDLAEGAVALRLGVEADDAGGLLRLMGIGLPIDPAALGRVALIGDVTGDEGQAVVRQRVETALGAASIDGTLIDPFGAPSFDGRFGLRSTSYRTLAAAFDIDLPDTEDSGIAFATDIATDATQAEFDAVLEFLGLVARASGEADGLDGDPGFDVRLQTRHGDLATLLRDLGVDGAPELGTVALHLTATGTADLVDVALAPSTIGPSTLQGSVSLALAGVKPQINARLEADSLALDPFLAATSGGTLGNDGADGGQRWSREEIGLDVLDRFDGRLELVAGSVSVQHMAVLDPVVVAEVEDGTLSIERLDGDLFDGKLALSGTVTKGLPHTLDVDVALADADMALLMRHLAESDAVTGRLFADLAIAGAGLSQRDLVQSLNGEATLNLRDGVVHGFDLRALSDRLGDPDDDIAIAALLADAGTGGQTAIVAADGSFDINRGVARSDDLAVVLDGGRSDLVATIDLPRWWIDMAGEVGLTDHASAPTIPIALDGPIDDPRQVVDTRPLEAFLIQRAAETVLRKPGTDALEDTGRGGNADALTGGITDDTDGTSDKGSQSNVPSNAPRQAVIGIVTGTQTESSGAVPDSDDSALPGALGVSSSGDATGDEAEAKNEADALLETPDAATDGEPEPGGVMQQFPEVLTGPQPVEPESTSSGNSSGSLLDLLGGSSGGGDGGQGNEPEPRQPSGGGLDTDQLLDDLIEGFGN